METRVHKWGNSLALRIPKPFAIEAGIEVDSPVEITLEDGKLIITPIIGPQPTLAELLAQVDETNLHGEVDAGPTAGEEIW